MGFANSLATSSWTGWRWLRMDWRQRCNTPRLAGRARRPRLCQHLCSPNVSFRSPPSRLAGALRALLFHLMGVAESSARGVPRTPHWVGVRDVRDPARYRYEGWYSAQSRCERCSDPDRLWLLTTGSDAVHITGVKRSAFSRLSGRQRSYADEVEGEEERQQPGSGRSHNKPPPGDSLREFVLHSLSKRGARPAYETFPAGPSSPAGR
jgi:hypothetical protein